mmetsp:Transcript_8593/g.12560  ORF Transcript_8593/g.12560 Transcript_8593/m.12560 type:complete len:427 (-) Transcript_8593:104-1384(-)
MSRLEGVASLESLSLYIPEHLASLDSIQSGFFRLLRAVPEGFVMVYTLDHAPFAVLPAISRAFAGSNVTKVCFDGGETDEPNPLICGSPEFKAIIQSVKTVESYAVCFDGVATSQLLDAMQKGRKLVGMSFIMCSLVPRAVVRKQPPRATSNKKLDRLDLYTCDDDFVGALASPFEAQTLWLKEFNIADNDLSKTYPIIASSESVYFTYDGTFDTGTPFSPRGVAEAIRNHSAKLKTLKLRYGTLGSDVTDMDMSVIFDAVPRAVAAGVLKHLICPSHLLLSGPLDGPWEQLQSLEVLHSEYDSFRRVTEQEVKALSSSLLTLSRSSNSLTQIKTEFQVDSDTVGELQQSVTDNFVGLPQIGLGVDIPIGTVISVLSRVCDVDESHVTAIRGDGLSLDALQATVTYDVVRLSVQPIVEHFMSGNRQ